jgi:hypothetical protein
MEIIAAPITLARLREMAQGKFGEMVKAVVDVDRGIMTGQSVGDQYLSGRRHRGLD